MILSNEGKVIFDGYDVVATDYVYTSSGGSGAEDGWISSEYDHNSVAVGVGTLTATTIYYRVEGRFDNYNRPVEILEASQRSVDTIDSITAINSYVKEIRVGVKVNCATTPNNVHIGFVQGDIK